MDEQRLIKLRDEYQANKDTYTPEQQQAMEEKFWNLVQKAMAEKHVDKTTAPRYTKPAESTGKVEEEKPYRVSL